MDSNESASNGSPESLGSNDSFGTFITIRTGVSFPKADVSFESADESDVNEELKLNIDFMIYDLCGIEEYAKAKASIVRLLPPSLKPAPHDLVMSVYDQLCLILRNHFFPHSKPLETVRSAWFYSVLQLITDRIKLDWNLRSVLEMNIEGETKVKLVNRDGKVLGARANYSVRRFVTSGKGVITKKVLLFVELRRATAWEGVKQSLLYLKYLSDQNPERKVRNFYCGFMTHNL